MTILEQTENRLRKSIRLILKMSGESTRNIDIIQIEGVDYVKREIVEEIMEKFVADQPKEAEKQWIAVSTPPPEKEWVIGANKEYVFIYSMFQYIKGIGFVPGDSPNSDDRVEFWLPISALPSLPNDLK